MEKKLTSNFKICSLLMGFIFAYSASVQLNDHDWHFWFPLYTLACIVNLKNFKRISKSRRIKQMIIIDLGLAMFLFVKVVAEDVITEKIGVLSLDLSHRVVREKIGSVLVIASMVMQLQVSSLKPNHKCVDFGMVATTIFSYGLPFWFFTIEKREIKI
ncbi:unnamed protein product [Cochlearia groenlandica]